MTQYKMSGTGRRSSTKGEWRYPQEGDFSTVVKNA